MPSPTEYGFMGVDIADANLGQYQEGVLNSAMNYSSNVLLDWASPQRKEERQMAQQWINDELEPSYRMSGMKRAGINPLTAAAGIAGSSTSVPQPQSSVNPLGDVAGAVGSLAAGGNDVAKAIETGALLGVTKEKIQSESIKNLESAGLDHWQAMSIAELLPGMEANQRADFYLKLGQFNKVQQEFNNLKAEHDNIVAQYNEILARTDVYRSEAELNDAQKGLIDEQKRWQQVQNEFFIANGYAADSPLDVSLRNAVVTGKGDPSKIGASVENYHYNASYGGYKADEDTAYNRAHNAGKGSYNADPYNQQYREAYDNLDKLYDLRSDAQATLDEIERLHKEGEINNNDYITYKVKLKNAIEDMDKSIDEAAKVFNKMNFSAGHGSFIQSLGQKFGVQLRFGSKK